MSVTYRQSHVTLRGSSCFAMLDWVGQAGSIIFIIVQDHNHTGSYRITETQASLELTGTILPQPLTLLISQACATTSGLVP